MNTLSLQLPDSLVKGLNETCQREGLSVDQFIALTIAEKLSALMTEECLQQRALRGSREQYEAALAQVPDVEPEDMTKCNNQR